jgi:hypothetical protein
MKKVIALCFLALTAAGRPAEAQDVARAKARPQERKSRPFDMGVSLLPHDLSIEGLAALFAFVNSHCDLISVKVDGGIPWQEALDGRPYPEEVQKGLEEKVPKVEQKRVFISATPLNGDKNGPAPYAGAPEGDPRHAGWRFRELDDPALLRAYLAWCRSLITRYRPDYFAYALEANAVAKHPQAWKKFVVLCKEVYVALKREYPALPVFVTVNVETANEAEQVTIQRKAIQQVLQYSDLTAVACLPYFREPNPGKLPKDYFSSIAALAPGKPFAVTETAFLAEDLTVTGFERTGKAVWQQDYLKFVLAEAARLNARLVVWLVPRDCDDLFQKLGAEVPDFFKIFKDTGLLEGDGTPRKAFDTWQQWFKLPRKT